MTVINFRPFWKFCYHKY